MVAGANLYEVDMFLARYTAAGEHVQSHNHTPTGPDSMAAGLAEAVAVDGCRRRAIG